MKKANELKKLRRENRALRRRIRDLEQHGAPAAPVERTSDAAAFDASNYFSYLLARLRQKRVALGHKPDDHELEQQQGFSMKFHM